MDTNKPFEGYSNGAEFWRDNAATYGQEEALIICRNYLDMQLTCKHSEEERQFCKEIFHAMFAVISAKFDVSRIIYPYPFEEANKKSEPAYYHANIRLNEKCTRAIDQALRDAQYEEHFCNAENAAWNVLLDFGFNRVAAALAFQIQQHKSDGRYSRQNKEWAETFALADKTFGYFNSHACLVDAITTYVRELYEAYDAEWTSLPGEERSGEYNVGYEILKSYMIDENQGYVLGYNAETDLWVSWQFYIREGKPSYNWGDYGCKQTAVNSYNARAFRSFYIADKSE